MKTTLDLTKQEFTPGAYKEVLCQYLQALGDDLILEKNYANNKRGQYVLTIRNRLMNNFPLTKKQNYILSLIEKELAKQILEAQASAVEAVEQYNKAKELAGEVNGQSNQEETVK